MELVISGSPKPSLDELAHFGVKGMRWGVRRADKTPEKQNRSYKKHNRESDQRAFGKGGVKRINRRMNKGNTYRKALAKEVGVHIVKSTAITAGTLAVTSMLPVVGGMAVGAVNRRAATNRGRAKAADLMGLPVGNMIKSAARNGVYNITSMK